MLKKLYTLIFVVLITLITSSCSNDNKGFREYYHPMGNNPVQVVPWLKSLRKSFHGSEGRIAMYTLNKVEYYTAQVFIETDSLPVSPFTIYEANDEKAIVYFHTEDALASEQDEIYINFIENATLIDLLWSNEKKHLVLE